MPRKGHFVLHSNVMPPLTAGRYELVSDQTGMPFEVAAEHTHVTVAAPRYTMPTDQILSTLPAGQRRGRVRRPAAADRAQAAHPALGAQPGRAGAAVCDALARAGGGGRGRGRAVHAPRSVASCVTPGTVLLDPADKDVEQGLYLAVTETVVKKIFPCEEDLPLLVHVREVDVNDTELANGDDDGWLAVVLANRLPVFDAATGKPVRYMACLVNLEGQLVGASEPEPPADHFHFELAQDWSVLAAIDPAARTGSASDGRNRRPGPGAASGSACRCGPPRCAESTGRRRRRVLVAAGRRLARRRRDDERALRRAAMDERDAAGVRRGAVARCQAPRARHHGRRVPLSDLELFAIERVLPLPGARPLVVHDQRRRDLRDADAGPRRRPPRHRAGGRARRHRRRRYPRSCRPGTSASTIARGAVTAAGRGTAGRWCRSRRSGDPAGTSRPLVAHAADQLRRVVPDGREDLSLAAAFEIGRLLGLSQLSIVSALLRFRSEQFGAGAPARSFWRRVTASRCRRSPTSGVDLSRFVALQLIGELGEGPGADDRPAPAGRRSRPGDRRARRPRRVIAAGLGLDLDACARRPVRSAWRRTHRARGAGRRQAGGWRGRAAQRTRRRAASTSSRWRRRRRSLRVCRGYAPRRRAHRRRRLATRSTT